ncbi:MAG: NADH-quinone oxidoreductase subunit C, partial [Planctomycetota bacterium]
MPPRVPGARAMTALETLGPILAPRSGPEATSYRVALGDLPTALAALSREGGWSLEDLFAIDRGPAVADAGRFEVVYRFARGDAARTLVLGALVDEAETVPSAAEAWSAADWCEREIHDLFGLRFAGHPALTRLLTHRDFRGHPLRKDHVAAGPQPLEAPDDLVAALGPWGENPADDGLSEFVPCDFGPLHPLMRGVARMLVKLDGERIARAVFEIGYQHKGVEKIGESCTWDGFAPLAERLLPASPLTARLAWHHAVEELLDVTPPEGALLLRVLGAELERVAAHARAIAATAAGFGETAATVALAASVPAIPDFLARARLRDDDGLGGFRDGPPQDLAEGVRDALAGLVAGLDAARTATVENGVFRARGRGLGRLSAPAALAAGATGPMLRSAGVGRDRRRDDPRGPWRRVGIRPELAIARGADVLARTELRFAEIRA